MAMTTVHPGEFWISSKNLIYTLLGTCVSVVLYSERHKTGGLNHYLLPGPISSTSALDSESGRYGINAMELLINGFIKRGIDKKYLTAKVFGGGKILETSIKQNEYRHIGEKNVDFVNYFLSKEKIPIIASDLGGNEGRKVYLFPDTGKVLVSKIKSSANLVSSENRYHKEIVSHKADDNVFFFNND